VATGIKKGVLILPFFVIKIPVLAFDIFDFLIILNIFIQQ